MYFETSNARTKEGSTLKFLGLEKAENSILSAHTHTHECTGVVLIVIAHVVLEVVSGGVLVAVSVVIHVVEGFLLEIEKLTD